MTFAGLPPTIEKGGVDFVTTLPAATTLPLPKVQPERMIAFVPIQTSSSTIMGPLVKASISFLQIARKG